MAIFPLEALGGVVDLAISICSQCVNSGYLILTKYEFRRQYKKLWSHLTSVGRLEWQILQKNHG
jgi:hypothetical protein